VTPSTKENAMNAMMQCFRRPARLSCVIALHCSGANAGQWRNLAEALTGQYEVLTPEHFGSESQGPWPGDHAFSVRDEAARTIALIDESTEPIYLVGHSYGGGVALNVALNRPDRIGSMVLYEPSAFHLLRQLNERGAAAHAEIAGLARRVRHSIVTGEYRDAAATFVDYWNGPDAWNAMRPSAQNALIRWAPKGPLDFQALLDDPTPLSAYAALTFPVSIMRGEHAPAPSRIISECLSELLPKSKLVIVDGAGHMGPITHALEVSGLIARYIIETRRSGRNQALRDSGDNSNKVDARQD
jgi:pimeloyl-ACP methyl ester carboxylesterase